MNDSLKIETSYWSAIPLKYEELFKFAEEATDEIERLQEEIRKLKEPVKDENMTDITEKLKTPTRCGHADWDMKMEAVAEIERLRAALRRIGFDYVELSYEKVRYLYLEHMQIARDAYGKSFPLHTDKPSDSPLHDNF